MSTRSARRRWYHYFRHTLIDSSYIHVILNQGFGYIRPWRLFSFVHAWTEKQRGGGVVTMHNFDDDDVKDGAQWRLSYVFTRSRNPRKDFSIPECASNCPALNSNLYTFRLRAGTSRSSMKLSVNGIEVQCESLCRSWYKILVYGYLIAMLGVNPTFPCSDFLFAIFGVSQPPPPSPSGTHIPFFQTITNNYMILHNSWYMVLFTIRRVIGNTRLSNFRISFTI